VFLIDICLRHKKSSIFKSVAQELRAFRQSLREEIDSNLVKESERRASGSEISTVRLRTESFEKLTLIILIVLVMMHI